MEPDFGGKFLWTAMNAEVGWIPDPGEGDVYQVLAELPPVEQKAGQVDERDLGTV